MSSSRPRPSQLSFFALSTLDVFCPLAYARLTVSTSVNGLVLLLRTQLSSATSGF